MFLPKIQNIKRTSRILNTFGGINRQESASVNEFADALNMSSAEFPCVAVRPKRKSINVALEGITGLINNNGLYALAMDGYDTSVLYKYDESTGVLSEKARLSDSFMAGYWECNKDTQSLFLTHDGLCTLDLSDPDNIQGRRIAKEYKIANKFASAQVLKINPLDHGDYCRLRLFFEDDGSFISNYGTYSDYNALYDEYSANSNEFGNTTLYFVDVKGTNYRMAYRINPGVNTLIPVDGVVARFLLPAVNGISFMKGDYIHITGMKFYNGSGFVAEVENMVNGFHEVINAGSQKSVISEGVTIDEVYFDVRIDVCYAVYETLRGYGGMGYFEGQTHPAKNQMFLYNDTLISLDVPELDCICEAQNRIWGASNKEHSIYCCALGAVNNWYRYEGISSDSWAATVGSEGEFTACTALNGAPVFFKENEMIVVNGSRPASYSITSYDCPGAVDGPGRKTCVHRGSLFYVSRDGVYSYTSSGPVCISSNICDEISNWSRASIFCYRNRLYVMLDKVTYVYDLEKGIWHKEDSINHQSVAVTNEGLVYVSFNSSGSALVYDDTGMNNIAKEYEEDLSWYLETKTLGNDVPAKKYLAQIDIALELKGSCTVLVKYDSGEWIRIREFNDDKRKTEKLCFYPRRSDHFKLRLEGVGDAKIFSITQTLEEAYENG
ncbi:MAG: hypothetical protein E7591_00920 [Ruminococcaceae bacterium]|nr:hypothetical protein [Oscillospiraceae bacterium]